MRWGAVEQRRRLLCSDRAAGAMVLLAVPDVVVGEWLLHPDRRVRRRVVDPALDVLLPEIVPVFRLVAAVAHCRVIGAPGQVRDDAHGGTFS